MSINRQAIYERDGGLCGFCGHPVPFEEMELDHATPWALGGPTSLDNLRVSHRACNRAASSVVRRQVKVGGWLSATKNRMRVVVPCQPELGKRVRELAERERRPLSSQIQLLIERALDLEPAAA